MKKIKLFTLSLMLGGAIAQLSYAQCRSNAPGVGRPFFEIETACAKANSEPSYLSDANNYRAMLTNNSADFVVVFYANNKYRIAACTDVGGPLSFTVKDHKDNVLFTNKNYENAPYWDLIFPTTIEGTVTISLPDETKVMAFGESTPAEVTPADSGAAPEKAASAEVEGNKKSSQPVCAALVIGYKQE